MPSQMRTAMTKMAAEEKLKIQELRVTWRGEAWVASGRGSSASNSRNGSEGFCSTRSVKVSRRSSNGGYRASAARAARRRLRRMTGTMRAAASDSARRSEEHTSELQSLRHLVCRLLLEK